mgnify:CR=1 FL=1
MQANLYGDLVFSGLGKQRVELIECLHGEGAGRLEKHLDQTGSVAPGQRICMHVAHPIRLTVSYGFEPGSLWLLMALERFQSNMGKNTNRV